MQKNIFNEDIEECCTNPITGFYRDGFCKTDQSDFGTHTVCTLITKDFLEFGFIFLPSKSNEYIKDLLSELIKLSLFKPGME